mgnify:FL=1
MIRFVTAAVADVVVVVIDESGSSGGCIDIVDTVADNDDGVEQLVVFVHDVTIGSDVIKVAAVTTAASVVVFVVVDFVSSVVVVDLVVAVKESSIVIDDDNDDDESSNELMELFQPSTLFVSKFVI